MWKARMSQLSKPCRMRSTMTASLRKWASRSKLIASTACTTTVCSGSYHGSRPWTTKRRLAVRWRPVSVRTCPQSQKSLTQSLSKWHTAPRRLSSFRSTQKIGRKYVTLRLKRSVKSRGIKSALCPNQRFSWTSRKSTYQPVIKGQYLDITSK